jgi:hypothetical protein
MSQSQYTLYNDNYKVDLNITCDRTIELMKHVNIQPPVKVQLPIWASFYTNKDQTNSFKFVFVDTKPLIHRRFIMYEKSLFDFHLNCSILNPIKWLFDSNNYTSNCIINMEYCECENIKEITTLKISDQLKNDICTRYITGDEINDVYSMLSLVFDNFYWYNISEIIPTDDIFYNQTFQEIYDTKTYNVVTTNNIDQCEKILDSNTTKYPSGFWVTNVSTGIKYWFPLDNMMYFECFTYHQYFINIESINLANISSCLIDYKINHYRKSTSIKLPIACLNDSYCFNNTILPMFLRYRNNESDIDLFEQILYDTTNYKIDNISLLLDYNSFSDTFSQTKRLDNDLIIRELTISEILIPVLVVSITLIFLIVLKTRIYMMIRKNI